MGPDDGGGGSLHPISRSSSNDGFKTPRPMKTVPTNRSPPSAVSVTCNKREGQQKSNNCNLRADMFSKLDHNKPSDCKIEVAEPNSSSSKAAYGDSIKRSGISDFKSGEKEGSGNSRPESKCVLFNKISDEKVHKFGGSRYGSRVVPFQDDENLDLGVIVSDTVDEIYENNKDVEDLSLIREQLLQIENQQSSLLDLLQVCCQSLTSPVSFTRG